MLPSFSGWYFNFTTIDCYQVGDIRVLVLSPSRDLYPMADFFTDDQWDDLEDLFGQIRWAEHIECVIEFDQRFEDQIRQKLLDAGLQETTVQFEMSE